MHFLNMAIADLVAIAALCTIYMIRHSRRELVISYTIINVGVFVVTEALSFASGTSAGMGLGLFGVLSIIRLRSTPLAQREVAYYFVSLALGLISGVGLDPEYAAYGLMAMLVIIMAVVDLPVFDNRQKAQSITVDRAFSDTEEAKEYLRGRLPYDILSLKILDIDMVNDTTRVEVSYSAKPAGPGSEQEGVKNTVPISQAVYTSTAPRAQSPDESKQNQEDNLIRTGAER